MTGGLYEKIQRPQRDAPSMKRIVTGQLDSTNPFDGELRTPIRPGATITAKPQIRRRPIRSQ